MSIVGRTILGFDYEDPEDYGIESHGRSFVVLHLDNGDQIYAMRDDEGNGPGVLMHRINDNIVRDEYIE